MNKIKSLLRNFKARTVSFFKAPYHKFYQSLWDSLHDSTICLVEDKLDNLRGVFITSSDIDDELNDCKTISDIDYEINKLQDDKLNSDDFDYELSQAYSFTELEEKVDSLEANSGNDLDLDTISDESHPISQLIDDRTHQIHSLILEVQGRLDKASDEDTIADLAIKMVDHFRLCGLVPLDDGEDETHFAFQDIIRRDVANYIHKLNG